MNTDYIKTWLKNNLSKERYEHTLGTSDCAKELAKKYNQDENKAYIAGLLHDCAKCIDKDELLNIIKEKIKDVEECELKNYKTFHAPVSALFAKEKFNIEDKEIISAIRWHTLGRVGMTTFEKIIFLADKIEARTRDKAYREKILKILDKNQGTKGLDFALLECFNMTIISLVQRQLKICQITIDVYNNLLDKLS